MSAITTSVLSSNSAPSACLWKENLNRPVSLFEMLLIKAYTFIAIGSNLQHLEMSTANRPDDEPAISPVAKNYDDSLRFVGDACVAMNLRHTFGIVEAIKLERTVSGGPTNGLIRQSAKEINRSFVQELNSETFLHVGAQDAHLLCKQNIFGPKVGQQFTSCGNDIYMAGNCFAVELYDSSVFHLMRALEIVLGALAAKFSVKYEQRNWHNIIEELESKIRKIDSTWGLNWKDQQSKYSESASQFMFFKDAWRNHVAHGRDTYDRNRAKIIFDSTGFFMQTLAELDLTA
jgi:hypothetical protein